MQWYKLHLSHLVFFHSNAEVRKQYKFHYKVQSILTDGMNMMFLFERELALLVALHGKSSWKGMEEEEEDAVSR